MLWSKRGGALCYSSRTETIHWLMRKNSEQSEPETKRNNMVPIAQHLPVPPARTLSLQNWRPFHWHTATASQWYNSWFAHIPHKKQACLIFSTWQCLEPHLGALGLCGGISNWTVHKGQSEDSEKVLWSHEAVRFVSSHKGTRLGMHYTNIMTAYVVILPKMHASFFQSEVLSPQLSALSNDKDSSGWGELVTEEPLRWQQQSSGPLVFCISWLASRTCWSHMYAKGEWEA